MAMGVYGLSALCAMVLLARWWARRGRRWRWLVWCLLAALMLTPAPVEQGKFAPAVIVGMFEILAKGWEGAAEPLAWLTLAMLLAVVVAVALIVIRGRRSVSPAREAKSS